jgi:hypothetical protein
MKKIIAIFIIGAIVLSSIGVLGYQNENIIVKSDLYRISDPIVSDYDNFLSVELKEATSYMINPGEPVLPKITKTYILPFGVKINEIIVEYQETKSEFLLNQIRPGYDALIDGYNEDIKLEKSDEIYKSKELFPEKSFNYKTTTGLSGSDHVVFLSINFYPIRYSPTNNILYYSNLIDIEISYENPKNIIEFPNEYDLLIISPSEFEDEIQPLIAHKNDNNIKTYYASLEQIYSEITSGRDNQENIKLFIKNAVEEKGIIYVLLIGGLKGQSKEWYLPVRYGHSLSEEAYLSDLYYSDLYKDNGTMFEDWDSNGNGKFAEFKMFGKDIIDGSPDVYIGRLPCRSVNDVTNIVNKIINYEKEKADDSWFKNMLLIGGDTYPESPEGFEAEIDTNLSASFMDGFNFIRLWASLGTLENRDDAEEGINNGAGFIHMAGHANPASLVTYPPYDSEKEEKIIILAMYDFYEPFHINPKLNNEDQLPIIVVGGCHNSQYNVTLSNMIEGIKEYGISGYFFTSPLRFFYMEWVPKCWSWWLTSNEKGGAIATLGNTGLGMGLWGFDYTTGLDGWLFPRFFYHYGQLGEQNIGMAHSSAITDYVNEFDINLDGEDRQMIQQWALIGDPSLMPGGYSN